MGTYCKMKFPSTPSVATIKRLFGTSGNRCAFPRCTSSLIDGSTVVGKICHIKAQSEGGPRYDPNQTPEERHGFDNLILMCGRHHDVIDDDQEAYTVEYLQRLKRKHEESAGEMSDDETDVAARLLLDQPVSSAYQAGGITAHTVNIQNYGPFEPHASEQPQAGVSEAAAHDGKARFRGTDEALGLHWNTIPFIESSETEIFLAKGPAIWLRLIPRDVGSREWSHDELLRFGRSPEMPLVPLLWANMQYLRAEDGIGAYSTLIPGDPSPETESVAFAFITGELWCVDTSVLRMGKEKRNLYFLDIARTLISRFKKYGQFLRSLSRQPSIRWIVGLGGTKGWRLNVPQPANHFSISIGET
jgi:hypothetical protein